MSKPIIVIAGVGNAGGTGAAVAREYASTHRVALIGRQGPETLAKEIRAAGGEAEAFNISDYTHDHLDAAFRQIREAWSDSEIRTAVWNSAQWSMIPFLDVTEADILKSTQINIVAAFSFAQNAVRAFLRQGSGGTLLITGATSATRGAKHFAAFAAGKHGLRAMSQSIAREYQQSGIHVCFVIVDGTIETPRISKVFGHADVGQRLSPASIARNYRWIDEQPPDAWSLELDLRPSLEHF